MTAARRLGREEILGWLRERDDARLARLRAEADAVRRERVGDEVHLRGLVEISNHCARQCGYCGLRAGNADLARYRMSADEIVACARQARAFGYGTVVLQSGEDAGLGAGAVAEVVRRIKGDTGLAVTLGLGERPLGDLALWRAAGADRYLLRFETSDPELYRLTHPSPPGAPDRLALLRALRGLGYEIGGGVMIGIPGQTYESLADDVLLFEALDLDMVGVGPYLPHPATPLGRGAWTRAIAADAQVPNDERTTCTVVALARLVCPDANIPSTTALATLDPESGRERALASGANVVMPNLTPALYRVRYEIYPGKACVQETAEVCHGCILRRLARVERRPGHGPGARPRAVAHRMAIDHT
jgi:biotin synthase